MTQQYALLLRNIPFLILLCNCLFAMFGDGLTYIPYLGDKKPKTHVRKVYYVSIESK